MKRRIAQYAGVLMLSSLAACSSWLEPGARSIAGEYQLATVDGKALPCCAVPDSATGATTTTLSGTLALGDAAPEAFVETPAGMYPGSCVHEVPSGTTVTSSAIPRCGDGDFTLTLVQRTQSPDGAIVTANVVYTGRYAWSDKDSLIKLVDVPMLGSVSPRSGGSQLEIQRVNVEGQYGETYGFAQVP